MRTIGRPWHMVFWVLMFIGCTRIPAGSDAVVAEPSAIRINTRDAVTTGGNRQAVLSLHKRYAGADSCRFGLTFINRLPYEIPNIAFRFAAYAEGDVFH